MAPPLIPGYASIPTVANPPNFTVAGNASVMFQEGLGEAKRAAKALQRPATSNTRNEAVGGRYVSTEAQGNPATSHHEAGAHDVCKSCGHAQSQKAESAPSHPYAPHYQAVSAAHQQQKRLADDTMQMLGYTVEGTSPIRGTNHSAFAHSTAGYLPQNYMAPSDAANKTEMDNNSSSNQATRGAKAMTETPEDVEALRERIRLSLGDRDPHALRSILSLIENKGQLSDTERTKVFNAASSAAAASSTLAASSDVRSKYANIVHKAEENSGVAMPNAGAVFARIGQHMNNAYDAAAAKRNARKEGNDDQTRPRSSSRGKAAGHTFRATMRASGFDSLPRTTISIAARSSSAVNHRAAGRYNPLQLGSAVNLGSRGLVGAKGNSSLALGSCAVERNTHHPQGKAIRGPSPPRARHGQGRARSADAPADHIRSLHYNDGIVPTTERPTGVRAVAEPVGSKKG